MEKERKVKVLSLVTLIVAVLGLTIAFAALSQSLKVNGRTEIERSEFDVRFDNLLIKETKGDAKVIKMPAISEDGTKIRDFEISLTKPGDQVIFNFDIVNNGEFDVELKDWIINGKSAMEALANGSNLLYDMDFWLDIDFIEEADIDGDGITTDEEKVEALGMAQMTFMGFNTKFTAPIKSGERADDGFLIIGFNEDSDKIPKGNFKFKIDLGYKYVQI